LGHVLQPGALLDDSLFPVTRLAASVGNRHHPKAIGSVHVEQGEWELCQPKLLDPWHIRHGWIALRVGGNRSESLSHPFLKPRRPRFARLFPIKSDLCLQLNSRLGVELYGFALRQHLHFLERLERVNTRGLA
jgi:hypothetical protein